MSVLIEGMEMPTNCSKCKLFDASHAIGLFAPLGWCRINGKEIFRLSKKVDCCPLVHVPPHGRLIDADALEELVIKQKYACAGASAHGSISELYKSWGLHDAELMIEVAPTIIPEEGVTTRKTESS